MYCVVKDEEGEDVGYVYLKREDLQMSGGTRFSSFCIDIGLTSNQDFLDRS